MSQFYIRLPSDSSIIIYSNNGVAHFNTKLAERIYLDGEYDVALNEIIHTNKKMNFYGDLRISICAGGRHHVFISDYKFKHRYFDKVEALIKYLNECLQNLHIITSFEYDKQINKIIINTDFTIRDGEHNAILMSYDLKDYLGFDNNGPKTMTRHVAEKTFDLNASMHLMYIYCDIVSYSLVGDTKAIEILLRVCDMSI